MKCPKCQTENPQKNRFCRECGTELLLGCPQCGAEVLAHDKFCGKCGNKLDKALEPEEKVPKTEGERKHITVLFSDLSGYTAMSERLDPEEVKEITSRIFAQISEIITEYEGFVEKFVGDAVMALFGVPKSYEDDPIRAIKAAREIHELVDALSPDIENSVGQPITMHTGINTGLVVTGKVDMEKGTHGVAGDTINLASRLSSLAKSGEILVGPDTYRQAEGHFTFEGPKPTTVKGKAEPIQVHKVLSPKERPVTIHRLSGLRAELIGRKAEVGHLREAVKNLREGKGGIFSVRGDAGTGKSRLVEEFRATLDLKDIQWLEGHAYAYSQNIPYYPLIDLLNRVFQIEEGDPHEKVREKVESGIETLVGEKGDIVPYVGGLYSLSYPELEDVSPEFWKSRLQGATLNIISALAQRAPTVFFLEDLHWADPSFVELLRYILLQVRQPAIVLCVYRPVFSLFTSHQLSGVGKFYQEIRLQGLSLSEAQDMLESLLETETIPSDLKRFVQDKAEGNPFYLEELVNSLIESETLIRDNGSWKIARPITESDISSTINGVISGRLDRLDKETKSVLQEASVIGRAFFYEILYCITGLKDKMDQSLRILERLDLIRAKTLQPDMEYIFKHALIQEVVYSGILKKERKAIHENIGLVMEQLFQGRLPEFYETLAFHFQNGQSAYKAIDYLMKSGEKSIKRYAVDEAHQYYLKAFNSLNDIVEKSEDHYTLLLDLLIKWAHVFYYRGDFKGMYDLFSSHERIADSTNDNLKAGMFYAWLGQSFWAREEFRVFEQYLLKALEPAEKIKNQKVIGYSCMYLSWNCSELGRFEEAILFGKRAQEMSAFIQSDQYLFYNSLAAIGYAYWYMGEKKKAIAVGKNLLEYGNKHSNIRSMVMGNFIIGNAYNLEGDFQSAISYYKKALQISADPFFSQFPRMMLGMNYILVEQPLEAERELKIVSDFGQKFGLEVIGRPAEIFLGVVSILKGNIKQGLTKIHEGIQICNENGRKSLLPILEYTLGKIYLQLTENPKPIDLSVIAKNIGFLIWNLPIAAKKAEKHLKNAIKIAQEIGAKGILGQAYLDLGILHKAKNRDDKARECLKSAIQLLEQCEAEIYLKQAKEAMASLGQ